jgi:hypothetical protein
MVEDPGVLGICGMLERSWICAGTPLILYVQCTETDDATESTLQAMVSAIRPPRALWMGARSRMAQDLGPAIREMLARGLVFAGAPLMLYRHPIQEKLMK